MEAHLMAQIIEALGRGDLPKIVAYGAIFFVIWRDVHGMKKELVTLNSNMSESFAKGEIRFKSIETKQLSFENRVTTIEDAIKKGSA